MRRLSSDQVTRILRGTSLLRGVSRDAVDALARRTRQLRFDAGETIFEKAADAQFVYWVIAGRIRVATYGRNGNESLLGFIEEGEMLGEQALVGKARRIVFAISESESTLIAIDRRDLLPVVKTHPGSVLVKAPFLTVSVA